MNYLIISGKTTDTMWGTDQIFIVPLNKALTKLIKDGLRILEDNSRLNTVEYSIDQDLTGLVIPKMAEDESTEIIDRVNILIKRIEERYLDGYEEDVVIAEESDDIRELYTLLEPGWLNLTVCRYMFMFSLVDDITAETGFISTTPNSVLPLKPSPSQRLINRQRPSVNSYYEIVVREHREMKEAIECSLSALGRNDVTEAVSGLKEVLASVEP